MSALLLQSIDDDDDTSEVEMEVALKEGFQSSRTLSGFLTNLLLNKLHIRSIFMPLLPSFFHFQPKGNHKLHPTDWLNGLRGVAAVMVVLHHSSMLCYPWIIEGWGSAPQSNYFVQLPIIRIFHAGSAMVAIFFIVSGFSLSYKPLQLMRNGKSTALFDSLSSSVFRRQLRLILPAAFVTLLAMLATYAGWFSGNGRQPPRFPTLWQNLANWVHSVRELADPFRPNIYPYGYNPIYDTNLWTIPVEFYGSMVIFLMLLSLGRVNTPVRVLLLASTVLYLLYFAYTHLFLFISGVLLAELHHMREERARKPQDSTMHVQHLPNNSNPIKQRFTNHPIIIASFWLFNFLFTIFLASMPLMTHGARTSPGYITLAAWIPPHYRAPYVEDHFWIFLGAAHLVFTVDNAKFLQSIFTTRFAQYLGKISFALYLLHGTFLYTLGWNLFPKMLELTGKEPALNYASGTALTGCVLYPLLFWAADVVARLVDAKSVAFARWLWVKVSVDL